MTVLPVAVLLFVVAAWPLGFMDVSQGAFGADPVRFLWVALMIGFLCSWVAMLAWNEMSQRLPAALGGQLIVFESVSSVIYALIYRGEWPTLTMTIGFFILMAGVTGSLHVFRNTKELAAPKPKALARRQAAAGQKA